MTAAPFIRAALAALDEAGDPTDARAIVERALTAAAPLARLPRPANARKRVTWAARQLAMAADHPARAYARAGDLIAALFEPLAGSTRPRPPAPEVAAAMTPDALVDALAPPPRVLARDIAHDLATRGALDPAALLADSDRERKALGIRAIARSTIGRHATPLAELACGPDPALAAEALAIGRPAAASLRSKLTAPLIARFDAGDAGTRARALAALQVLDLPLDDDRLVTALHDASAEVRTAAARSIARGSRRSHAAGVEMALIARLADDDAGVRAAALGAVMRYPAVHGPALIEPLCAIVDQRDRDARDAVYLLGRLAMIARTTRDREGASDGTTVVGDAANANVATSTARIVDTLIRAVLGPHSDLGYAAERALLALGVACPDIPLEVRLARSRAELASADPAVRRAGLDEARRLGAGAAPLLETIGLLARRLTTAMDTDERARVRATLTALGVADAELPVTPSRLEPHDDRIPREIGQRGAYAIGDVETALGLWDRATGKRLFAIEGAVALAFVPRRTQVAVIRVGDRWWFERYGIPSGERLGSIEVPEPLTAGRPASIAIAGGLATVWCELAHAPYRFHVALDDPDRVIDEAPVPGARPRRRWR